MKPNAKWDWALFYYVGTVILHMSPNLFWRCSPKKFNNLCRVHAQLNTVPDKKGKKGKKNKNKNSAVPKKPDAFIDDIF